MKTILSIVAVAFLCSACDVRVEKPPAEKVEKNTTIVNPAAPEKKTENNTTIVNPPAKEEKKVENNTTIVNPPAKEEKK